MAGQDDFDRFFFEIWLNDSDDRDEYELTPELYVRFEYGSRKYVAYAYDDGTSLGAEEYEPGLCRPSRMSDYSSVMYRDEMDADEARKLVAEWQRDRRPIPEEDVPLCEEAGRYYCGTGSLSAGAARRRKERWKKIPRGLRNRLWQHVGEAVVRVPDGSVGTIVRVESSGMVVSFPDSGLVRRFPLCRAFRDGELEFTEPGLQASAEATLPRRGRAPRTPDADVAANVRLACWLVGVGEDELLGHMAAAGLPGSDESLEAVLAASPFAAVREAARRLGSPLEALVGTDEEVFRWLLGVVGGPGGWCLCVSVPGSDARGQVPSRTLAAFDEDGRVLVLVADYADPGFSRCVSMRLSTTVMVADGVTVNDVSIRRELADPGPDVARAFADSYAEAGGEVGDGELVAEGPSPEAEAIRVNEFLVRRSYGSHATGGHRLDPVLATVSVLPRDGGGPVPEEFWAWWCPKCGKHFMSEGAYMGLKRRGYICCKVVEERELETARSGEGAYGRLAPESVLHMYGYNVNRRSDLSEEERRAIISFVIENGVQTAQEVARLLEWLIAQREGVPGMSVAVGRWRADLDFVRSYHGPTRRVRVDSIYARV